MASSNSRCINAVVIQMKGQTSPVSRKLYRGKNLQYIQSQPNPHTFPEECDDQIKLQRQDKAAGFAAYISS
jgi:hypothetical protein